VKPRVWRPESTSLPRCFRRGETSTRTCPPSSPRVPEFTPRPPRRVPAENACHGKPFRDRRGYSAPQPPGQPQTDGFLRRWPSASTTRFFRTSPAHGRLTRPAALRAGASHRAVEGDQGVVSRRPGFPSRSSFGQGGSKPGPSVSYPHHLRPTVRAMGAPASPTPSSLGAGHAAPRPRVEYSAGDETTPTGA